MKFAKKIGWILLVLVGLFSANNSFAQLALITNVKYVTGETEDYLDFTTTSSISVQKEVFPKTKSVLLQLLHTEFMPDSEDRFVNIVKQCFLHTNVVQLDGGTIYILFKGISAEKIRIKKGSHLIRVRIQKKSSKAAYRDNYRKGVALVQAKKYRKALKYLRRALHYRSGDAATYFWAGKARFALGDWEAARFNFKKAREQKSLSKESDQLLAFIQKKQAQRNEEKTQAIQVSKSKNTAFQSESISNNVGKGDSGQDKATVVNSESSVKKAPILVNRAQEAKPKNSAVEKKSDEKQMSQISLGENERAESVQLILFFAILILFVSLPFLWIWNKRSKPKRGIKKRATFEKNLEAFQARQQQLLRRFETKENENKFETDSTYRKPMPKRDAVAAQAHSGKSVSPEAPLIRNHYSEDEIVKKAKHFASRGYTYDEIARKLGIGKGELQLIMNLAGETVPMGKKTGMRLTFAEDN